MSGLFPEAAAKPRRRHDFIVPPGADRVKCSSCGAAIAWTVTGNSKRMPLDLSTVHDTPENTRRAESHFAHCPSASRHRRRN